MAEYETFREEFLENLCFRMDESLRMVKIATEAITEEQLWQKPNPSLNSIANLILHLCGNMKQYGIDSLQGIEDDRDRDWEFSVVGGFSKQELLQKLSDTVAHVKESFYLVSSQRLVEKKWVQGFEFSGIGNAIHVVEHFSYHTGQIAYWVKFLFDKQLGFYKGHDLNIKNE
ncbi:MAG: DUF1572 family protein [Bacteroidota bacterium]